LDLGAEHRPRPHQNHPVGPAECRATLSDRMNAGGETNARRDHPPTRPPPDGQFSVYPQVSASRQGHLGDTSATRQCTHLWPARGSAGPPVRFDADAS